MLYKPFSPNKIHKNDTCVHKMIKIRNFAQNTCYLFLQKICKIKASDQISSENTQKILDIFNLLQSKCL